ncbi:O-antigen ligase family protein [Pseudoalteromonas prydzensis]|uniref:O-antigen ligase family protein n=1 Tax=Pseudoalteromonas prydzensis TaxID=182141 RepID=A0ABR9FRP0_9GAMM|nr:O-antigen ligase family protein [Pseudoalteromonas prydzensis]MBE0459502.1 O-antigen ligase family protein [Pseudoalteromonas prydzensis]
MYVFKSSDTNIKACCFILFLSVFMSRFNFDFGVSLQIFHAVFVFLVVSGIYAIPRALLPDELLMLLFYILFSFTGIYSIEPAKTIIMILGLGVVINYALITRGLLSRLEMKAVLQVFAIVGKIIFWFSLFLYFFGALYFNLYGLNEGQKFMGVMVEKGILRAIGISTDPNFLSLISIVFVFFFLSKKNEKIYAFGFIILILLTLSRGGAASLVVGLVLYLLKNDFKKLAYIVLCSISFIIIFQLFIDPDFLNLVFEKRMSGLETGAGRFDIWSQGLKIFEGNEVFGIGIFQFQSYNKLYFSDGHFLHNTYFEVLIEGGVVVFAVFMLMLITFTSKFVHLYLFNDDFFWILPTIISFFICIFGLSAYASPIIYTFMAVMNVIYLKSKSKITTY